MEKKIKILVVPSDRYGVGLYRSVSPHVKLNELYGDEFDVNIEYEPKFNNPELYDDYDIIHFHKGIFRNMEQFWSAIEHFKQHGIKVVMDIDDYWSLPQTHPAYSSHVHSHSQEYILKNLTLVDYVTTTTKLFANKIKKFNKNVFVFPNAIDPEEKQYSPEKNPSDRIRFGFVMGSSHEDDMKLVADMVGKLTPDILSKIQIVLCGFDTNGTMTIYAQDGTVIEHRPIKPEETVWYRYEKELTNNYKIISPEYTGFLLRFAPNSQWPNVENEVYRREWTKDVSCFAEHYRNIDVLLAPLNETDFNLVKSELKLIEAGFTNTAVIASNFGPYTLDTKSMFEFGGGINKDGNCILIDKNKSHKGWSNAIKKLVANPELIKKLASNLHETVKDKFDINKVTKDRAEFYKNIVGKP